MLSIMTYGEVADLLEAFADGRSGKWDWHDYMSATIFSDPYLQEVQCRMIALDLEFPPQRGCGFCSAEGFKVMRAYSAELRRLA
ncbi:MAG: hypothetical protein ACRYFU_08585 [Janthinobacterium lividum]